MSHNDDDDLVAPSIIVAQRVLLHLRISVRMGKMDTILRIVIQQQQQQQTAASKNARKKRSHFHSLGFIFHILVFTLCFAQMGSF